MVFIVHAHNELVNMPLRGVYVSGERHTLLPVAVSILPAAGLIPHGKAPHTEWRNQIIPTFPCRRLANRHAFAVCHTLSAIIDLLIRIAHFVSPFLGIRPHVFLSLQKPTYLHFGMK